MKTKTIISRLSKSHLVTKKGLVNSRFLRGFDVFAREKSRPCHWATYGHLTDYRLIYLEVLTTMGIDFERGNDAPRGGMNGEFFSLTAKGRAQAKEFLDDMHEIAKDRIIVYGNGRYGKEYITFNDVFTELRKKYNV